MKFLFSPAGLIIIAVVLIILFFPRRTPDRIKKIGKPMRAFEEEPKTDASEDRQQSPSDSAKEGPASSGGSAGSSGPHTDARP